MAEPQYLHIVAWPTHLTSTAWVVHSLSLEMTSVSVLPREYALHQAHSEQSFNHKDKAGEKWVFFTIQGDFRSCRTNKWCSIAGLVQRSVSFEHGCLASLLYIKQVIKVRTFSAKKDGVCETVCTLITSLQNRGLWRKSTSISKLHHQKFTIFQAHGKNH